MMKKWTSVLAVTSLTLAMGIFTGCSHSQPEADAEVAQSVPAVNEPGLDEPSVAAAEPQSDSINLGAASAGRAH